MNFLFVGLATIDVQYAVSEFPKENLKIKTASPNLWVGGPSTNAAVACSFLNGNAHLISSVGKGDFSTVFKKDFRTNHLEFYDLAPESEHTVLATVITSEKSGSRTIFSPYAEDCQCTKNNYWTDYFDEHHFDMVMVDGFYPSSAIAICREARKRHIPVVFDGGSWKDYLPDLLPWIDVAICSNDFHAPGCETADELVAFLNNYGIRQMAITRGASPILFSDKNGLAELAVEKTDVADTLGAGDFFHGAFCYYFAKSNSDFSSSLQKASSLASATCSSWGTRNWLKLLSPNRFI